MRTLEEVNLILKLKDEGQKVKEILNITKIPIRTIKTIIENRYSRKFIPKFKYSENDFINAVKNSTSIHQVLLKLNLVDACGGSYSTFHKMKEKLQVDTSHFTGMLWCKDKVIGPKRDIEDYLSNKIHITSHRLRLRLIADKIFENKCSNCNLSEWLNEPIPLELDHIDGNHDNNNLINLRLLCCNCHAKTATYCRNKKSLLPKIKNEKEIKNIKIENYCLDCKIIISDNATKCKKCVKLNKTTINYPEIDVLIEMLKISNYSQVAKSLGISDNALRKHFKKRNIPLPKARAVINDPRKLKK